MIPRLAPSGGAHCCSLSSQQPRARHVTQCVFVEGGGQEMERLKVGRGMESFLESEILAACTDS